MLAEAINFFRKNEYTVIVFRDRTNGYSIWSKISMEYILEDGNADQVINLYKTKRHDNRTKD